MLQMIKMPKPKSCSICCIAMLTGKSFEEAMVLCFGSHHPKTFCMDFDAMEAALQKANLNTHRLEKVPNTLTKNALIECRHKTKKYWHYIVYDAKQQTYLDPIPSPPPIEDYRFYRIIETLN